MNTSFLILLPCVAFVACASPHMAKIPDTMALTAPMLEETTAPPTDQTVSPEEFSGLDSKAAYSLTVKNADIRDTLLLLSRQTGLAIVVDREVNGTVTVDLQSKPPRDILYAILKPLGYTVYLENGIIRVSRPRLISRSFVINYLKGKRTSSSTMNAAISESGGSGATLSSSSINLNLSTTGGGSGSSGSSSSSPQGNVSIQTAGVSDFWSEMVRGLEIIIFGEGTGGGRQNDHGYSRADKSGRKLVVNELAGLVQVRDFSDNMENVKAYIDDVEKAVKRQVLIQAHIVEVTLNDNFSLGIDWDYIRTRQAGSSDPTTFTLGQKLVPTPATNVFQFSVTNNKLNMLLDAMKEQGQIKMLSSPKVSTLNNQKAVVKLSTKEVSWVTNTAYNAQGNVLVSYTTPQVDEVGIFLDVTPQINDQGVISMQIHPSISDTTRTSTSPDGKSSKPIIDVREVDTMIDVKNGQTIVIAGLISDKISETRRSVPFLGDIPFLGALFRYTSQKKEKTELVMFITPYILTEKSIADIRKEHEQRLNGAGRAFVPTPLPH